MSTHPAISPSDQTLPDWSPRWWLMYVIVPVLLLVAVIAAHYAGGAIRYSVWESPVGILESGTGALALVAAAIALIASFQPLIRRAWAVRGWLLAFVVALIYFAGEDLNWGQYYFGWETPQYFLEHNKEHETNLHNISTWFNQKPRIMVELWLLVACILVPLGWRQPRQLTARLVPAMFWPDGRLVFIAVMALVVLATDWMAKRGFIPRTLRWSEVEELFFAYGWLLYSMMLLGRVRSARQAGSD
jgi:hypothetical protein